MRGFDDRDTGRTVVEGAVVKIYVALSITKEKWVGAGCLERTGLGSGPGSAGGSGVGAGEIRP